MLNEGLLGIPLPESNDTVCAVPRGEWGCFPSGSRAMDPAPVYMAYVVVKEVGDVGEGTTVGG